MNGATPYDALVPIAVNLLVSLAKPLFRGIKDPQLHDNAVRAFTFLLAAVMTTGIALTTGDTSAQGALQAALSALYGGSAAIAIFHSGKPSTSAPAPQVSLGPVTFGTPMPPLAPLAPAVAAEVGPGARPEQGATA